MIGLNSSDDLADVYEETTHIFKKANMSMHQWNSNCEEFWSQSHLVKQLLDTYLLKCWE